MKFKTVSGTEVLSGWAAKGVYPIELVETMEREGREIRQLTVVQGGWHDRRVFVYDLPRVVTDGAGIPMVMTHN